MVRADAAADAAVAEAGGAGADGGRGGRWRAAGRPWRLRHPDGEEGCGDRARHLQTLGILVLPGVCRELSGLMRFFGGIVRF